MKSAYISVFYATQFGLWNPSLILFSFLSAGRLQVISYLLLELKREEEDHAIKSPGSPQNLFMGEQEATPEPPAVNLRVVRHMILIKVPVHWSTFPCPTGVNCEEVGHQGNRFTSGAWANQ